MGSEEEEEEEYLVHVEFDSLLDSETFNKENLFFKVIGIDSEKPIMQIGDQVFTGEYRDTPGTSLFFEEDESKTADDPVFAKTSERTLSYKYKTRKALVMRRVFIKKKDPLSDKSNSSSLQDDFLIDEDIDLSIPLDLRHHSENLLGTELEMEIAGFKLKEEMAYNVREKHITSRKQSKLKGNKSTNPPPFKIAKTVKHNTEPVAGPSWAPDTSTADCLEMLEELPCSSVNADEMSRLIVEQMTLESDIKMLNSASPSQNAD